MVTLNQHIEIFSNLAKRHRAINTFFFGQKPDVGADSDIQYPLMAVYLQPTRPDKSGMVTRRFVVDVSDRKNKDTSIDAHVLSDTERICFDIINYLEQVADSGQFPFSIGEVSELTDYYDETDDETSGWYFTIETKTHLGSDSCNLPITNGTVFDGNYIVIGGTYNGNCSPVIIRDQDGNIVTTVQPGGTYTITIMNQIEENIVVPGGVGSQVALAHTPSFVEGIYIEGQRLTEGLGFTISANVVTWLNDYTGLNAAFVYSY